MSPSYWSALIMGAAVPVLTGCGTMQNLSRPFIPTDPRSSTAPAIYGGVCEDVNGVLDLASGDPSESYPIASKVFQCIDLPLSAVADTLTLPLTVRSTFDADSLVKPDSLQHRICKADVLESSAGSWKLCPDVVLREIPLGTPVDEAQSVMKRQGFSCRDATEDNRKFLLCRSSQMTSWITSTAIEVRLYNQTGKITDVEVATYYEGP